MGFYFWTLAPRQIGRYMGSMGVERDRKREERREKREKWNILQKKKVSERERERASYRFTFLIFLLIVNHHV